ncbi:MAG: sulfotransferase [Gammaproteobacteria bacterium]
MGERKRKNVVTRCFYALTGKLGIVDKNNHNGLSVSYLFTLFPDAHFVYVKRNPGDNIESLIKGWNKADEFATWSEQLSEAVEIDRGRYRRWCFFLPDGWRNLIKATSIGKVAPGNIKPLTKQF